MKRKSHHESSLDLLLDTICNMFGMVIFIAVLAAVIATARGEQQIAEITMQMATESMPQTDMERDQDSQNIERDSLTSTIESSNEQLTRNRNTIDRLSTDIATLSERIGPSDPSEVINQREAEVKTLEDAIQEAKSESQIPVRTPRRHTIEDRIPVQVVMTGGRLYVINDWSSWRSTQDAIRHRCEFWAAWNTNAVVPEESIFEDHGSCQFRTGGLGIDRDIKLRADGGIDMHGKNRDAELAAIFDLLDHRNQYVSFRVTPDTFDQFHAARRAVVERGLDHNVEPITLDDSLIYRDRIERGAAIAQ